MRNKNHLLLILTGGVDYLEVVNGAVKFLWELQMFLWFLLMIDKMTEYCPPINNNR